MAHAPRNQETQRRRTGPAPVGYRKAGGRDEPDPATARLVLLAFELAALPGASIRSVHRQLAVEGMRAGRGGGMSLATLHRMLGNPFYAGLVRRDGKLSVGGHEPIVPLPLFQRAQRGRGVGAECAA